MGLKILKTKSPKTDFQQQCKVHYLDTFVPEKKFYKWKQRNLVWGMWHNNNLLYFRFLLQPLLQRTLHCQVFFLRDNVKKLNERTRTETD